MFKIVNTLLLLTVLFTACSGQESKEKAETNTTKIKETVADTNVTKTVSDTNVTVKEKEQKSLFTLTTLEGKTIHIDETEGGLSFKEFKDKVVLVLFFGHRCPPCLREIPVLVELTKKGHKDLEILAVEVQGLSEEQLKTFKEMKGINYNLVANTGTSNFVNYIAKQANWSGAIPFLIGFDKKSVVKVVHAGGLGEKDFDNIYSTLAKAE